MDQFWFSAKIVPSWLARHTWPPDHPLFVTGEAPDDSESQGLSLREKPLASGGQICPCKLLFNYREWPSFALAARNFLKTVPKGLEASTCTEHSGGEEESAGPERGWNSPVAPESGQKGTGPGPGALGSLPPVPHGLGLGLGEGEHRASSWGVGKGDEGLFLRGG